MKKRVSVLLIFALFLSLLTGCSGGKLDPALFRKLRCQIIKISNQFCIICESINPKQPVDFQQYIFNRAQSLFFG